MIDAVDSCPAYHCDGSSLIKEITMLELATIDLDALVEALEDHSDFLRWFIDPVSGEVLAWSENMDGSDPEESGAFYIHPIPSEEAYRDMQDFVERVDDPRAADLLERAIEGRGAFRRFKDTLFEFPELRETWFVFHDVRMRRRAIEWLSSVGLLEESGVNPALTKLEDPPVGRGVVDPYVLASEVARELRGLFGSRLVDVVLFGSHATGVATEESDLDLAVVLQDVRSAWEDARCMDELLWDKTLESGITLSALVVDAIDWKNPSVPLLKAAMAQGRSIK